MDFFSTIVTPPIGKSLKFHSGWIESDENSIGGISENTYGTGGNLKNFVAAMEVA